MIADGDVSSAVITGFRNRRVDLFFQSIDQQCYYYNIIIKVLLLVFLPNNFSDKTTRIIIKILTASLDVSV